MKVTISCSEIRLYEISKRIWERTVLGETRYSYRKGTIMHKLIENGKVSEAEKEELSFYDIMKVKKVMKRIEELGEYSKAKFKERSPLRGICDGFVNGNPIEVKFSHPRDEDRWQAMAYCELYSKNKAYLIYEDRSDLIFYGEREKFDLKAKINEIIKRKIEIMGDILDSANK